MSPGPKSKAEIQAMLGRRQPLGSLPAQSQAKASLSVMEVQQIVDDQVGQVDLGPIGTYRAKLHRRRKDFEIQTTLIDYQADKATELLKAKIDGEVAILRMHFARDFSDRIAHLAGSHAASQTMAMRQLKAVEAEARNYLFHDLKHELDELNQMLQVGVIDEEDFAKEAQFRLSSYDALKSDFVKLFEECRSVVQETYRSAHS